MRQSHVPNELDHQQRGKRQSNVTQQEEELPVPSQKCKKGKKPSKNDNFSWSNTVSWDPPRSSCIQEKNLGLSN